MRGPAWTWKPAFCHHMLLSMSSGESFWEHISDEWLYADPEYPEIYHDWFHKLERNSRARSICFTGNRPAFNQYKEKFKLDTAW